MKVKELLPVVDFSEVVSIHFFDEDYLPCWHPYDVRHIPESFFDKEISNICVNDLGLLQLDILKD